MERALADWTREAPTEGNTGWRTAGGLGLADWLLKQAVIDGLEQSRAQRAKHSPIQTPRARMPSRDRALTQQRACGAARRGLRRCVGAARTSAAMMGTIEVRTCTA